MLTRELAEALRDSGLEWHPGRGDRFVVPDRDLDDQVFVVSDMVIDVLEVPGDQQLLAFNGTTEWALDSLEADAAIWLPREDQLRVLLGAAFGSLERLDGEPSGWAVVIDRGGPERHVDVDAECAYARAVLAVRRG